jgi:hypothetical protein
MKRNRWGSVPAAAAAVVPVESAIGGKRFALIEQADGCHESMAPFFTLFRGESAFAPHEYYQTGKLGRLTIVDQWEGRS